MTSWWMGPFSVLLIVVGVGMVLDDSGQRGMGIAIAAFGLSSLLTLPLMRDTDYKGQPRVGTVPGSDELGLLFPYMIRRAAWAGGASFFMALGCFAMAVSPQGFSFGPTFGRWFGIVAGLVFSVFVLGNLRHMAGGVLALTPSGIINRHGLARSCVPWDAVKNLRRTHFTVTGHLEPFITIDVDDRRQVQTSRAGRILMGLNAKLTGDVNYPARHLATEPGLAYEALCHYWRDPSSRYELGQEASLKRLENFHA